MLLIEIKTIFSLGPMILDGFMVMDRVNPDMDDDRKLFFYPNISSFIFDRRSAVQKGLKTYWFKNLKGC